MAGRRTLVLDGEIVALSGPRPDFTLLQRRMRTGRPGAELLAAVPVTLIVFDVLRSGRDHLVRSPYVLRRALLEDLGLEVAGSAQVPPAFPGDAAALLAVTRDQGLEGIVLKRPASLYHPGRRTREWLKIRNIRAVDVRVGGWLPGTGARRNMAGSVLMGLPRQGALEFAGTVGSGLTVAGLRELTALLESAEQAVSPFAGACTQGYRPARPVGPARPRRRGGLPGAHPVRAALPPGLARPKTRLAACTCWADFRGRALAVALYSSSISLSVACPGGLSGRAGSGGVNAVSCPATAW